MLTRRSGSGRWPPFGAAGLRCAPQSGLWITTEERAREGVNAAGSELTWGRGLVWRQRVFETDTCAQMYACERHIITPISTSSCTNLRLKVPKMNIILRVCVFCFVCLFYRGRIHLNRHSGHGAAALRISCEINDKLVQSSRQNILSARRTPQHSPSF